MEAYLFSFTLKDFLRFKRLVAWILILLALFGIAKVIQMVNANQTAEKAYISLAEIFLFRVEALAAAIFSTAVISAEMEQKTIVYLLTRPLHRWKLVLYRTLAAIAVVAIIGVATAATFALAAYGPSGLGQKLFLNDVIATIVGAAFYTSFFVLLSLWINRSMIVSLLFAFGWESIVGNIPGDMRYLTISAYLDTISKRPAMSDGGDGLANALNQLSVNTMTTGMAWLTALVSIGVCLAVSAMWFSTHEYLPREDVE
jgi:ABC-2 type transport system permease protein